MNAFIEGISVGHISMHHEAAMSAIFSKLVAVRPLGYLGRPGFETAPAV